MGLPVPIIGGLFNIPVALVAYALGAFRFYSNYRMTTFEQNDATKARLVALWPILFVGSDSFRQNFKKAVKG
jgi:hypothetical protein